MRPRPTTRALACLLAAGALLAGCGGGSDSTDDLGARAAESRPAPPKSDFPSAEGKTLREVAEARRRPLRTGRLAGRDGLLQGREPLPVRRLRTATAPRSPTPKSPSTSPRCPRSTRRPRNEGAKGGRAREAQNKALDEPAVGPFPASIETPRHPARLPRADDQRRPRRRHGRLLDRARLPQRRRVADRGADQGRRRTDRRRCCRAPSSASSSGFPGSGEKAPLIHTPTAAGRRRRPLEDHDADPAGHPEPGRLRGRAGQGTDRPLVCDPPVLPESGLRPRRRRGRAGQTALRRQGGLHPHGDLQRQRPEQGRAAAGAGLPPAERAVAVRDRPRRDDRAR